MRHHCGIGGLRPVVHEPMQMPTAFPDWGWQPEPDDQVPDAPPAWYPLIWFTESLFGSRSADRRSTLVTTRLLRRGVTPSLSFFLLRPLLQFPFQFNNFIAQDGGCFKH